VNRLARWTTCALVGAASLTSCATFDDADTVASVGEKTLTEDDLEAIMTPVEPDDTDTTTSTDPQVPDDVPEPEPKVVEGGEARIVIQRWIVLNALDDAGFIDQASKDAARAELEAQVPELWPITPAEAQDIAILTGAFTAIFQSGTVAPDELEAAVRETDVSVDPRYGRWDADTFEVLPLGDTRPVG
jgi:hypothetical protein